MRTTARSESGSLPATVKRSSRPSVNRALPPSLAPTTWAEVSMKPSWVRTTPLPAPACTRPRRVRRWTRRLATERREPLGDARDRARVGVERLLVGRRAGRPGRRRRRPDAARRPAPSPRSGAARASAYSLAGPLRGSGSPAERPGVSARRGRPGRSPRWTRPRRPARRPGAAPPAAASGRRRSRGSRRRARRRRAARSRWRANSTEITGSLRPWWISTGRPCAPARARAASPRPWG